MKNPIKNFFKGASSVTLYPPVTKVSPASLQKSWNRVWESFSIVNNNLNGIIYGNTQSGK